jgi:tetratricopeptide (TPR) repeat protein
MWFQCVRNLLAIRGHQGAHFSRGQYMKSHQAVATPAKNALAVLRVAAVAVFIAFFATARPALAGQAPTSQAQAASAGSSVQTLEAAVKTRPTAANRLDLSRAYINAGQPEHAILVLLSLVAEDKNNALAWNNLCVANILQQAYVAAVENCNRAITLEPNNQLARNNLRWAEDEQRKAISDLVGGEKTPSASRDAAFYVEEGLSQLNAGHTDAAIASWQRALELDPRNALAANNIGDAYMVKKQPDTALQWFLKASLLDPTLQLAKNNMVWAIAEKSKAK